MIEAVRRKLLKWIGGVDRAEHSRILNKLWRAQEEQMNVERQCQFELARMRTALDEKERVLHDCKNSLMRAALELSVRNVGPIEQMADAIELLQSALCQSMIPPFTEGKIRRAIEILQGKAYGIEQAQHEANGAD